MATHGTPMSSTPTLYRPVGTVASAATASPATPMHAYATQPPKPFAAGAVQSIAERSRLLELLRAPNNLTSPTLEPPSKGLLNGPGQNNCFLNCAVQVSLLFVYIIQEGASLLGDPEARLDVCYITANIIQTFQSKVLRTVVGAPF